MPIKLGLVLVNKHNMFVRPSTKKPQKPQKPQKPLTAPKPHNPSTEQQGITLKRVMNAPKTGCKSCGG